MAGPESEIPVEGDLRILQVDGVQVSAEESEASLQGTPVAAPVVAPVLAPVVAPVAAPVVAPVVSTSESSQGIAKQSDVEAEVFDVVEDSLARVPVEKVVATARDLAATADVFQQIASSSADASGGGVASSSTCEDPRAKPLNELMSLFRGEAARLSSSEQSSFVESTAHLGPEEYLHVQHGTATSPAKVQPIIAVASAGKWVRTLGPG